MSLGETLVRPTAMLYRDDGVVLLAGCDKTTPAQLMGAVSVDVPCRRCWVPSPCTVPRSEDELTCT